MERRVFLKLTAASALGLATAGRSGARGGRPSARVLVLLRLAGGNDGLNTVVPFADPAYRRLRPRLALPRGRVIRLDGATGLHPELAPLVPAWRAGELAVVQGVGYAPPNRSHFRSTDIWDAGTDPETVEDRGWIARVFAERHPAPEAPADGLTLGAGPCGALAGGPLGTVALARPERTLRRARALPADAPDVENPSLAHVLHVRSRLSRAAARIDARLRAIPEPSVAFPGTAVGRQLALAARLIVAGVGAPVLHVTHGGFDTHARQADAHGRLLGELAGGLAALRTTLVLHGAWDRVLVMTVSEFGRRAAENGSAGTDHGTAAPHFLLGGRVAGGLFGARPSLTELSSGDLRHAVDFRSLLATVARGWWGLPASALQPHRFPPLDALR